MAERRPGWGNGVEAADARLVTGALVQAQATGDALDPLRVRPGIRDGAGFPGNCVLASNKVTVNPFQGVLADPAKPGDGAYIVTLDSARELPFGAQHASLRRIDLVVAEITSDGRFAITLYAGESAATPVRPVPSGSPYLVLAEITVPPAGSNPGPSLVDKRQFTAAAGAILPVRGEADLPPAGLAHGSQFVYRLDTGQLQVKKGNAWVAYRPQRGDTWHAATLQNGWQNYGAGFNGAAYTVMDDGWVRLRGLVKSGAFDKPIFTLPVGFRPVAQWLLPVSTNPDTVGRVDIHANGSVMATTGSAGWLSLDALTFSTY
ncbi:hypothetical protein DMH01_02965 [Amycolatopsis sp. WAC 04182]|uniref:hypothetical protein n=1 Tax=Amycolatopsis sp. WAC 04182 TaxID=2203198 RepID=UPI000F7A1E58|nr:hypothetical protein [Amycolatopsis sp. WAC 04182]RSN65358.1 hypothetical protein DMH01_02965 [Amycolatopsis sp. WAC 04182]